MTLRCRAVGTGLLPYVAPDGAHVLGRYAGRDRAGAPCAEDLPDTAYYRRGISEGALELVTADADES